MTRVVITGIGLVTALGTTREESWRRMIAGDCGIGATTVFDTQGYRSRVAAEVDMQAVDEGTPIEVSVKSAYSKGGIPLNVHGIANIKIAGEQPVLDNAVERFLGVPRDRIMAVAKETLEGNLRGVLATLTPEDGSTAAYTAPTAPPPTRCSTR